MSEVGERIGPYVLTEWISSDAHTSLYRAIGPEAGRLPQQAAVRVANIKDDEMAITLLEREYQHLNELHLPHLPIPIFYQKSSPAMAIEWVEGLSLSQVLKAQSKGDNLWNSATVMAFTMEVAEALWYLHRHAFADTPITYGRLHPDRVILSSTCEIVLLGLGRDALQNSPSYSPPEQANGAFIDWRSDQWALGSLMVHMFLGAPLYQGEPDIEDISKRGEALRWIKQIDRKWHKAGSVIARMLAPAAGNRYQNEEQLVRDLSELTEESRGEDQRHAILVKLLSRETMDAPRRPDVRDFHKARMLLTDTTSPRPVPPPSQPLPAKMPTTSTNQEPMELPKIQPAPVAIERPAPRINISVVELETWSPQDELLPTVDCAPVEEFEEDTTEDSPAKSLRTRSQIATFLLGLNGLFLVFLFLRALFG